VNTPHLKRSLLRTVRHAIGQTDEKHGHLRPGYSPERLRALLEEHGFEWESHRTYSRFFSEVVDTAINFGVERLGKRGSAKGMVVTGADVAKHGKAFRAYSAIYPLVWAVSQLDRAIPFVSGYMLIATARRRPAELPRPSPIRTSILFARPNRLGRGRTLRPLESRKPREHASQVPSRERVVHRRALARGARRSVARDLLSRRQSACRPASKPGEAFACRT
jgi:hypothetical protein